MYWFCDEDSYYELYQTSCPLVNIIPLPYCPFVILALLLWRPVFTRPPTGAGTWVPTKHQHGIMGYGAD